MKRDDVISWQDYFVGLALLSAKRSKDPNTQVGACIVNQEKRIVGIGYNGFPQGISDDEFPWGKNQEDDLGNKYPYVCHAELPRYAGGYRLHHGIHQHRELHQPLPDYVHHLRLCV